MALGGGTFATQNKVLPGAYINVISAMTGGNENSRGIATISLELDWGPDDVFSVGVDELRNRALELFGYEYNSDKMKYIREIFKHAAVVYFYKLNSGGNKASNKYGNAKYGGKRGNDIKIIIENNVDDSTKYTVKTVLDATIVDTQIVDDSGKLIDNEFVIFNKEAELEETAGTPLSGGTNGVVNGTSHKDYMDAMESFSFNVMGTMTTDEDIKKVYVEYIRRMRDDLGIKCQCVIYNCPADYEGIINVKNGADIIPWVVGAQAQCELNHSCTNMLYDGELAVNVLYTQSQLEKAINSGEFTLHRCGQDVRVLTDINSLVSVTENKNSLFKSNQTIRIADQLSTEIASLFNTKYIGKVPNNDNGRASLWADIVSMHKELEKIGAIENFSDTDIAVSKGTGKGKVVIDDVITLSGTMEQLYMTVIIQ